MQPLIIPLNKKTLAIAALVVLLCGTIGYIAFQQYVKASNTIALIEQRSKERERENKALQDSIKVVHASERTHEKRIKALEKENTSLKSERSIMASKLEKSKRVYENRASAISNLDSTGKSVLWSEYITKYKGRFDNNNDTR